jgi:hypothetical protein
MKNVPASKLMIPSIESTTFGSDMLNLSDYFVDVCDSARLHVAALTMENVKNERIFAFSEPYNWNKILAIMRQAYPNCDFPKDIPNEGHNLSKVSNGRGAELLQAVGQTGWTSLEVSVMKNLVGL